MYCSTRLAGLLSAIRCISREKEEKRSWAEKEVRVGENGQNSRILPDLNNSRNNNLFL